MLLPLKYNDGRPIEDEKIHQTREELLARFDAISFLPGTVQGIWIHKGARYEDELLRVVIDVEDLPENRGFLVDFKAILCERFEQLDIYIASHPIDIVADKGNDPDAGETQSNSVGMLMAIDNGLRDGRGRLAIVLLILAAFGFLWSAWVGMPNPMFGSEKWILKRFDGYQRNVEPIVWGISCAVEVSWVVSWFALGLLLVTSSRTPATNPNSTSYAMLFVIILNVAAFLVFLGLCLAPGS